jgi:uncharacterized protein (UPF0548 family)
MRLVISKWPPDERACARWDRALPTSPPEGPPNATLDRYVGEVRLLPSEDAEAAFKRVRARLFAYDIFPPRLMRFVVCPPGPLSEGALVVQRVGSRLTVESAVRVVETWDQATDGNQSAGFRYVTVAGHPERGCASFEVRRTVEGRVHVILEARSRAGNVLTQVGRPVARWAQTRATKAALRRLTEEPVG